MHRLALVALLSLISSLLASHLGAMRWILVVALLSTGAVAMRSYTIEKDDDDDVIAVPLVHQQDNHETTSQNNDEEEEEEEGELIHSRIPSEGSPPVPLVATTPGPADETEAKFKKLYALHHDDRPFEAIEEMDSITIDAEEEKRHEGVLRELRVKKAEIYQLHAALENHSEWKLKSTYKKCDIYSNLRDPRDFKVVSFAPDTDIFNFIALIYETDLYQHWMPGCVASTNWIHTKFFQNLYLRLHLPYPFQDRDLVMKGYGDVWRGQSVMIFVKSVAADERTQRELKVKKGAVRISVLYSGMLFKPKDGGVELTMISRLELNLPFLPDVVFDYAAKYGLAEMISFMRERAKRFGKPKPDPKDAEWARRIASNPVYNEVRERLSSLSRQQGISTSEEAKARQ